MSASPNTDFNQGAFFQTLFKLISFIETNISGCEKAVTVARIKLETGIEFAPAAVCKEFVTFLTPFVGLITARDDSFILENLQHVPIVKDLPLHSAWGTLSDAQKAEVWNIINAAYMLASASANAIVSRTASDAANVSNLEGFDPAEMSDVVTGMLPAVMGMLGPMLQNLQGGGGGGGRRGGGGNAGMQQMLQTMASAGGSKPPASKARKTKPADSNAAKKLF